MVKTRLIKDQKILDSIYCEAFSDENYCKSRTGHRTYIIEGLGYPFKVTEVEQASFDFAERLIFFSFSGL